MLAKFKDINRVNGCQIKLWLLSGAIYALLAMSSTTTYGQIWLDSTTVKKTGRICAARIGNSNQCPVQRCTNNIKINPNRDTVIVDYNLVIGPGLPGPTTMDVAAGSQKDKLGPGKTALTQIFKTNSTSIQACGTINNWDDDDFATIKIGVLREEWTEIKPQGFTHGNPQRSIVKLIIQKLGGKPSAIREVACSGALIGPRHVLTAAHCLYETDTSKGPRGYALTAKVMPGVYQNGSRFVTTDGIAMGVRMMVPSQFILSSYLGFSGVNISKDYGVIQLNTSIGQQSGFFSMGTGGIMQSGLINGYPANSYQQNTLYGSSFILNLQLPPFDKWILEGVQGIGGISGGPLWTGGGSTPATILGVYQGGNNYRSIYVYSLTRQDINDIYNWVRLNP